MYDLTTAVPLIIRAPGSQAGIRKSALVGSTDIWATMLDFAGLKVESDPRFRAENGYACRSLRPLLDGTADRVHDAVFMEYNRFGKQFDQAGGLYPIRCVVTPEWKLSINLFDSDELYSRADDPDEAINRIADPSLQAVRIDLHDQLLAWQHSIQDVFRGEQWARRAWRPDYPHHFVGLTTTGYKEKWASPRF
jgi:arylsulfatase A-like enzyme